MTSDKNYIIIVSGLPRSGTSMMMRMLNSAGLPILKDDIRKADIDNPKGYFEFEKVKKIEEDQTWLSEANGKAVKMISQLLLKLPLNYNYRIIFMKRNMDEVIESQKKMLFRKNKKNKVNDIILRNIYEKHIRYIEKWLSDKENIETLYINYNILLKDPQSEIEKIISFLNLKLDKDAMIKIIDPALYRQRKTS